MRDANGREHEPAGIPEGGRFAHMGGEGVFSNAEKDALRRLAEARGAKKERELKQKEADEKNKKWAEENPNTTVEEQMAAAAVNQPVLSEAARKLAQETGAKLHDPGMKTLKRVLEKLATGGRLPKQLTDIVRLGFDVRTPSMANRIVAGLRKMGFELADQDWQNTSALYFDRKALVRFPNGQVGEIQFWAPGLLEAKNTQGHALYEQARVLPNGSPEKLRLERAQQDLYRPVVNSLPATWQSITRGFAFRTTALRPT